MVGDDLGEIDGKWMSGAVADDGCLYSFPFDHNRILKFNPNDDTTIFVGEEIEGDYKFSETIKLINGYLYGISFHASRVAKFNVATQEFTFIGDKYKGGCKWMSVVVEMDDNIYGVPSEHNGVPSDHNKWLKIDITIETKSLVGGDLSKYE